jgi:ribosomal protein S17
MNSANNVIKFLKENDYSIGRKIYDRADAEGKKLLPILKKKYKKEIAKSKELTKAINKLEAERTKIGDMLEDAGLSVGQYLTDDGEVVVRFETQMLERKYKKEVFDIKNEAILTGVTPELTKRLLALL